MIIFPKVNDRENHKSTVNQQMYPQFKLVAMG